MSRVSEIINRVQKNGTQKKKSRVESIIEKSSNGNISTGVDEKYIEKFLNDSDEYFSNYNNDIKNIGYKNHSSISDKYSSKGIELSDRADTIRAYLNSNKNNLDDKAYKESIDILNKFDVDRNSVDSQLRRTSQYYSKWKTEEEYENDVAEQKQAEDEYNYYRNYDLMGKANRNAVLKTVNRSLEYLSDYGYDYETAYNAYVKQKNERYKTVYDEYISKHSNGNSASIANAGQILQNQQLKPPYATSVNGKTESQSVSRLEAEAHKAAASDPTVRDLVTKIEAIENGKSLADKNNIDTSNPDAIKNEIHKLDKDFVTIGYIQKGIKLTEAAVNSEDFEEYAKKGAELGEDADRQGLINDEVKVYNWHLAKDKENGTNDAERYLYAMEETINYRKGKAFAEAIEGNTFLELLSSLQLGGESWVSSVKNAFSDELYIPYSADQIAAELVRDDLSDDGFKIGDKSLGQIVFDAGHTTGNMAPTIASSFIPVAGPYLSAASIGVSSYGSSLQQARNEGYGDNAEAYAFGNAVSEAGLSFLLSGFGKAGGKLTGKSLSKVTSNISKAGYRVAAKLGIRGAGEFTEEYLQAAVVEPVLSDAILGTDKGIDLLSEEALYNGFLGAITSSSLGTPGAIGTEVKTALKGRSFKKSGNVDNLVKFSKSLSADSFAYKLADKVNEKSGAYTVGRLLHEAGAESLSATNMADIEKSLIRKGLAEPHAKNIAGWLNNVVMGGKLTKAQRELLDSNEAVSETFRDVILNKKSTVNQRTQEYNSLLGLAYEMENVEAPTKEQISENINSKIAAQKEIREAVRPTFGTTTLPSEVTQNVNRMAESMPTSNKTVKSKYEVSADGETFNTKTGAAIKIAEVASIKDGVMMLKTEDGETVNVKDVSFGSQDEALIYETVADLGIDAVKATNIVKNFNPNGKVSALVYAADTKAAYEFGLIGYKRGIANLDITLDQAMRAYEYGRVDAEADMKAKEQAIEEKKSMPEAEKVDQVENLDNKEIVFEDFTYDDKKASKVQKASMAAIDFINKLSSLEVHVYKSFVGKNGKRMVKINGKLLSAPNGYFKDGNRIYIDLNAGNYGQGTMLYTFGHEIGHDIAKWSPEDFKAIGDFVVEKFGEQNAPVKELIQQQINKLKKSYKAEGKQIPSETQLYKKAYEELVCDAMGKAFADENAYIKFAELKQQNSNLYEKFKNLVMKLLNKVKKLIGEYSKYAPDTAAAQYVGKFSAEDFGKFQDMVIQAFVKADENYADIKNKNTTDGDVQFDNREEYDPRIPYTYRADQFSYETLTSKPDMKVTTVGGKIPTNRADVVVQAKKNAASVGKFNKDGSVSVYVDDVGAEVVLATKGLSHGLRRIKRVQTDPNFIVTLKAGEIIKNSIKINEILPSKEIASGSYVLIGVANNTNSDLYIVRSVINQFNHELNSMDVLYAINAKKEEPAATKSPRLTAKPLSVTGSTISISDLLDYVNKYFPDVLPESVLRHYGYTERPKGVFGENVLFSERDTAYKDAIESGDTKTQEKIVADAAKSAGAILGEDGNPLKLYRGTKGGQTIFSKDVTHNGKIYTTDKVYIASNYSDKSGETTAISEQVEGEPATYALYGFPKKMLTMDAQALPFSDLVIPEELQKYSPDSRKATNAQIAEWAEQAGYDALRIKDVRDGGAFGWNDQYIFFDENLVKSADAVTRDNDGNIIPPSKRFNENETDIRYQERDEETVETYKKITKQLSNENIKLIEDVKRLKELVKLQKNVTHGKVLNQRSLQAVAKKIMRESSAKGDVSEFTTLLNDVYSYIVQGEDLSWEGIKEKAQGAVEWLQNNENHKVQRSEYADLILKELRTSRISLTEKQKQDVAFEYGSYGEFYKRSFGRLKITNDGIPLDSKWQELAEMFPGTFDLEENEGNQPGKLMEIIDSFKMVDMNEFYHQDEMYLQDLLTKIYDGYWDVSTLHTVADAKQREINILKSKHKTQMDELRESHKTKDAELKKEQKEKISRLRTEYKERNLKKLQKAKEEYQESRKKAVEGRERTAMRHKIQKVVSDLNTLLLKPTKERHVPEEMRIAVAEALNVVNMDTVDAETRAAKYNDLIAKATDPDVIASLTETRDRILEQGDRMSDKLTKLKDAYSMVRDSADDSLRSMYDDVIYNIIESVQKSVGKTPLRNMTLAQLESVHDLYTMVLTTVRDSNKAFAEDLKMSRLVLGSKTFAEIKENNKKKDTIKHPSLGKFLWQNLKPMQAMKTIGSGTLQKLWNNVLYGQEVFAKDFDEAVKFAEEMKKKYGFKKWNKDKMYSFESKSGKTMKLNLEQMMSIYAYSKRPQADEHIEYGGIVLNEGVVKVKNKLGKTVEVKVNDSTAHRLDKMQVGEIVATLEKEAPGAKKFVDEMQKYLSETMGAKGNEVAMKMYGIKLFKEEHYFPLKSSKDFMEAANAKLKGDVKIKNKGMTKSTVEHARNPIVLENFLDVWGNHINEMAMYHGLVLPLEDFSRTLNYSFKADENFNTDAESVRTALHDAFGENADNYLNELLKAINGGVLHDSSAQFADKMISKFKKAKVMASLSVIVQQPTAIIRAMSVIEPKYFVAQSFKHKATWEELKKYCPTAIIKEAGSFDTNMGRTIVDMIKDEQGFTDKVGDFLGKAPAYMDEMGWNMIWRALKKKVAAEQKLSGEALLKECGKQMTLILNETQVYDSVMSRNELMRSKGAFTKMATAFMAEPTTVANMIYGAGLDFKRGKKGLATKTVASVISSVVINGLVSAMVYALRDDDEEKTLLEKYLSSATTEVLDGINPFTYIPFVKDAYSLFQGYKVERTDMSLIKDVADAIDAFYSVLNPEEYEDKNKNEIAKHIYENSVPMLTSICDMFGLPVGNVLRDAEAIIVNDNIPMSQNSSKGMWYAFKEGLLSAAPKIVSKIVGADSKQDKLYDAIMDGDKNYINRLKNTYKDNKAYNTAVRTALRENDPRIKQAAEARLSGDMTLYKDIVYQIKNEGHFDQDNIVAAIMTEYNTLKSANKEESSESSSPDMYNYSDYYNAIINGDADDIAAVKDYLIEDGKTEKNIASNLNSNVKEAYEKGEISISKAKSLMVSYGGKTKDEADIAIRYVDFKADYPEYKDTITESKFANYYETMEDYYGRSVATTGLSFSYYFEYCVQSAECTGIDADGDGRADSGTKKAEVMKVINSLPITIAQKDALYFLNGWSKKTLFEDAPWR